MSKIAPSYVASVVAIVFNLQGLLGFDFTSQELTGFVTVVCALVVAARQVLNGRSDLVGGRPETF